MAKKKAKPIEEKEQYFIIDGNSEQVDEDDITVADLTPNELAMYMEHAWDREENPPVIIPLSVIQYVIKHTPEGLSYDELVED